MSDETEEKVIHLKVVKSEPPETTADEDLRLAHEHLVKELMEDGPFEWIMGVARRRDGSVINFGTSMEIRDFVFAVSVIEMLKNETMTTAFLDQ